MVLILNRIVIQSFAWIILAIFLGTIMYLFCNVIKLRKTEIKDKF